MAEHDFQTDHSLEMPENAVYALLNRKDLALVRTEKELTEAKARVESLESQKAELENQKRDLEKQLLDKRSHVQALEKALAYHCMEEERYKNMLGTRLQMFAVRVVKGILRRLKFRKD